jgi:hypothetical protein
VVGLGYGDIFAPTLILFITIGIYMRLYTFVNHYLSPIQHGIQTAHVVAEMFIKYGRYTNSNQYQLYRDWADNHKTIIVCNGGFASNIQTIVETFETQDIYPFAHFHEGVNELNGALTAVGIVVPEFIYSVAKDIDHNLPYECYSKLKKCDVNIARVISRHKLS